MLAVPVIATIGLWFMRVAIIKNNKYQLSPGQVIFIVVYVALVFEIVLPHFFKAYTRDYVDILMYAIGGVFFYKMMNKPILA